MSDSGKGGNGGSVTNCCEPTYGASNGKGGKGGHGINASGGTITNTGIILGGDGGASGTGGFHVTGGAGDGGDGIVGSDLTVVNSSAIGGGKGGAQGNGPAGKDGYAIRFQGGTNRLELHAGSNITGIVYGTTVGGATNTFVLSGDTDATFAGNITSGITINGNAQYYGFQTNEKTGASIWSLTGSSESWTIKQGVLQIGDGGTGGTITGNVNTGLDATMKGTLAFNHSDLLPHSGVISGTGNIAQRGSGTTVLSADNTYTGSTILDAGTLSVSKNTNLGDAAGALSFKGGILQITGTTFNNTTRVINWGSQGGGFDIANAGNTFTVSQNLGADGAMTKLGAGKLVLSGNNTYTGGTTVFGGILQLGDGTTDGSIIGDIALGGGDLIVNNNGATTLDAAISGTGNVTQKGTNTLTLSGNNSYGDTFFMAGVISVGQEANLGSGALNFDGGTLRVTGTYFRGTDNAINWGANGGSFDITDANNVFALSNVFTGAGGLTKSGNGTLALSGDSSGFTGNTDINTGSLRLDGGKLGDGKVNVASGASLGGHGTIGGMTTVADSGNLFGQTGQRLNFLKDLTLNANSNVDVTLHGRASINELFHVAGNLTVNGTLTVNPNSNFGAGLYRIFQTDGILTNNGMDMAPGSNPNYELQVLDNDGQINLINDGGLILNFWDGAGPGNDDIIQGGNGIWNGTNTSWTDKDGILNGQWGNDNFAVFQGTGGTVTIEQGFTPTVSGMQFFVDGYRIENGSITLGGADNWVLVGNGDRADSRNMTATIASALEGQNGIVKGGYGTLNLTGTNTYSGTTTVNEGTLELSDNGSIDNSPEIVLAGTQFDHGDLRINKEQNFTLENRISGIGAVVKDNIGTTVFAGNNTYSGGLTVEQGIAKAGIADNAFGSGNVSIKGDAKLDLDGFNETVGNLIGEQSGDGDITLGFGTLTLNQNLHGDFSGSISGTGGITKNGDGDLILYGQNHYSGATTVNKGDLVQGTVGGFSAASAFAVVNGASIRLGGFDTTLAALSNGGDIYFGGTSGAVLNVAGNYTGNGGTLHMSAVLGDDNSLTDRMNVNGDTSGTSQIAVNNRQGFGGKTSNGIEIIKVDGNSDGIFTLNGDYKTKDGKQAIMTDSAYAYTLQKGGINTPNDGNWYLVSQMIKDVPVDPDCKKTNSCPVPPDPDRFSPAAPVYESYTATLQALNKLPTLQQRVGERYLGGSNQINSGATDSKAVWGRIEGGHNRQANSSTAGDLHQEINTFIMQAGVDGQFYENENGKLIAGITGQYGNARSHIDNRTGDGSGSVNTQGWGLGATTTWYDTSGFYVDAQAQANWYDSDLGIDAVNPTLRNGNKSFGYAMSLEAGQRIAIDQSWSLTPQTQLIWSAVDFDTFTDSYGARISNRSGDSLTARLGLAAHYADSFTGSGGRLVNTSVYGIANLYQELMGDARINYAGTPMTTGSDRTWGGIGAGGSYVWADNKYALYGEGTINTSLNHFADSYAFKGTVGFRAKW
ncbi:autotransporter outer membrane beta-barrel domain-containing protein [Ochrobactrum sp. SFR4]|uniref:autotransporter outer membrane beta-barrel domain-containing protein n=1 Tax=Ochrobactrum sp. SFR4 TaxID=2717368 RepID=UPI001C8C0A0D|nr:autotransporter outer membrane beta-barrel domain-containing protein [Ochrobactrum sp. SFR4]MBX8827119.1 autotransporter outer membrane beta-barrel domain-containing protein [Ochrobactrum sp. SFR4]